MASLVDTYNESNANGGTRLDSADFTKLGQSFTAYNAYLDSCKFYLSKTGSPTGNITANLYAHSGAFGSSSVPTGAALATSTAVSAATVSDGFALVTFTFDGTYLFTSVNYVITIEYSGGDASNRINVGTDTTSPTHSGNYSQYSGSWSAISGNDLTFYVYGNIPAGIHTQSLMGIG